MNLDKFKPLDRNEFDISEMYHIDPDTEILTLSLSDLLTLPVNKQYEKNKQDANQTLDSNFKSAVNIDEPEKTEK
jgi:hypothetical protein